MKILNCMLSKNLGGIEQAFLDYDQALTFEQCEVVSVCHAKSILADNPKFTVINSFASWDLWASFKLRNIIKQQKIELAIAHGNRPIQLLRRATKGLIPLIGMAHNYSIKYLKTCDYIIAVTEQLREYIIEDGFDPKKIISIPNMINLATYSPKASLNNPILIGCMGRFVPKKGFDLVIKAIHHLKQQNILIHAIIGGVGEEEANLKQLAIDLEIDNQISFPGWIKNKNSFFKEIDLFVLPSHHEPFGIVMIESMANSVLLISSNAEGPTEVLTHHHNALLFEKNNYQDLAENIKIFIENPELRLNIVQEAYQLVQQKFSLPVIAKQIKKFLDQAI